MKQRTTLMHYTLKGLSPLLSPYILSPISKDVNFYKDFEARAQLIRALLDQGADPNGRAEVEIVNLTSKDFVSTPGMQQETAWARLLQIIAHTFDDTVFVDNTVSTWVELVNELLKHGANHRELVQNLKHHIQFSILIRTYPSPPCMFHSRVVFNYQAQPLDIITNFIRNDELTYDITRTLQPTGHYDPVRFNNVYFHTSLVGDEFLRKVFDIENLIYLTNEGTWDVSHRVLDHLAAEILGLSKYKWDSSDTTGASRPGLRTGPFTTSYNFYCINFYQGLSGEAAPNPLVGILKKVLGILNEFPPLPREAGPSVVYVRN
ncbi:uncharacterized protein F4817DRAFT_314938 [Daldinia loculata]|uniref:uncharacterized protein n=1 Tax=Daldinia loculata TaxID=103429 RepID=UPI0020C5B344|nr:uncharacterized protein F4817DRAFT_314938 [Daldinia loculata]KAI1648318.1 hypothetical protein F4817DRAFT_314938 [Daldinia loculata]